MKCQQFCSFYHHPTIGTSSSCIFG